MEICKLIDINKTYTIGESISPLININLTINSGDFISIEGPSGIGKSTLLYIMGTMLRPDSGKLIIDGKDILSLNDREITSLRGSKIGFIFQDTALIEAFTLEENLKFTYDLYHKDKNSGEKIDYLLGRLGLMDRKKYLPHQLSGGQRRRAIIARALINDPILILGDEPTNDLDEKYASEVISLLSEACNKNSSVVMVTHNTKWAKKAKTRYNIDNGSLNLI